MVFNFVSPEGVPSSCTPLSNTGESMVVGPERIDQTSSLGWKGLKEGKSWRRGIIPRMISVALKKIECIEGQLGIFIDSHPARPKVKSSPRVKGIVVDGVISKDNGVVQKAIKEFWGNLLSSVRPYNKDSL